MTRLYFSGIFAILLFVANQLYGQCDSNFVSISTTGNRQTINGVTVSLSGSTNAQSTKLLHGGVTGYYLGDGNITEEINFTLNQPIRRIKVIGRALSATKAGTEYFTFKVNGNTYRIQPHELISPDPAFGNPCFLLPNGSVMGDSISIGDGSFIFLLESRVDITSFQVKDSISNGSPEGGVFDVQISIPCKIDTPVAIDPLEFRMPTAFTPDGNGRNDLLRPLLTGSVDRFEFMIYNRWGQIVYATKDLRQGWNGFNKSNQSLSGMYVWVCIYQKSGQPVRKQKGWVTLLR